MKILDIKHIEDCFDGSFIQEIVFNEPISKNFIFSLGKIGKLYYLGTLPRPFFKIIMRNYEFKGVEGNPAVRMHVKHHPEESLEEFRKLVFEYNI